MSLSHRQRDHRHVAEAFTPQATARARISTQRAERLREFILGHLPEGVTVDVIITPGVQTAAVLPADLDAILSSDATEIERAQAERLLAGVDADYLVLVTGNAAEIDRIPLNDQLTADHAHQFGLAFHELLHILKTAITAIGELLDREIDPRYHEQVHDLINIIEDGAIESEAIHGENFSDNAGIRLELTRRLHSQTPESLPDGQQVRYTFWDAVTSCLYDAAIYPTGITDVLLDEDDDRIRFKNEADRNAFVAIHGELCNLSGDVLAIRSAARDDTTHAHDKTASIRRARRIIDTWKQHIQPVLEADDQEQGREQTHQQEPDNDGQDDGEQSQSSQSGGDATGHPESASDPGVGSDTPSGDARPQSATSDASADASEGVAGEFPDDFDPSEVSLSREATDDPHQDIFEQPQVTPDPDPDDVDSAPEQDIPEESGVDSGAESDRLPGDGLESHHRAQSIAGAAERVRERDGDGCGQESRGQTSTREEGSAPSAVGGQQPRDQESQLTLDSFGGDGQVVDVDSDADASSEGGVATSDVSDGGIERPDGPAHAQQSSRSPEEEQAAYEAALAGDERAAHDEADHERIDEQALENELGELSRQLARSGHQDETSSHSGAQGSPGSLDTIDVLPISDDLLPAREWAAIEAGADRVAETLEMYLRLDRRKSVRRGLSAGAYDTRAGHRLAIGDPRVCKSRTLGNEKQYSLVLVLDRSGSMRGGSPPKIEVATQALARFALAAENLGIRVAIIDFYRGNARLVKPFSVETRHVQHSLLDTSCGGGTPLADALGLARTLIETQRDEPLIITVTDDQPRSVEAVKHEIHQSVAPICSLTIATDCQPGALSGDTTELARHYERQEAVYSPERLDDRLDQFASLLGGL